MRIASIAMEARPDGSVPPKATSADEPTLVARAASDPHAFAELYRRHYDAILNYAFRCTLNVATAEEITSATFMGALRAISRYRPTASFRAWLFAIAANQVRMHLRSRRRRPEMLLPEQDMERIVIGDDPNQIAQEKESRLLQFAQLHRAMMRLPPKYQTVITLRHFEELSYDEMAQALHRKVGTIKSLVSRGLAMLRREIESLERRDHHE